MNPGPRDIAQTRLANALALFDEFVHTNVKHADAATLRGLEGRFAEKLQIQPSYWSQIKGRSRQIGERLARQFEQLCRKPAGWMDEVHGNPPSWNAAGRSAAPVADAPDDALHNVPQDDDERFIVGLVLTYYRRHPQRARQRLLDLLGEVLTPPAAHRPTASTLSSAARRQDSEDDHSLWARSQTGVAPLKPKR